MTPLPRTCLAPLLLALVTIPAFAQNRPADAGHRLGDHPAVVVQRLQRSAGYDYASKFYPHPAGLYLLPAAPDEIQRMQQAARAAVIDATPDDAAPVGPLARR